MYNYFVSGLFFLFFIFFLYFIGTANVSSSKCFAYRILIGYLIFEFFVAIVGIPIQLLDIPWKYFMYYLLSMALLLVVYSSFRIKKYKIHLFEEGIVHFFRNHWIIMLVVAILILLMLTNVDLLWANNHLDDGFYITKIASLPYVESHKSINFTTGLYQDTSIFNNYLLNCGELEQSVYVYLLNVSPTVFLKFGLSAFQYFLFLCCIYAIANKIFETCHFDIDKRYLQYVVVIAILFGFIQEFLTSNNLLIVQDSWQYNTAMFYGSSIVRVMGILLILIPFINNKKIYLPDIISVIGVSVVLISKSTIALPIIFVTCLSYLLMNLCYLKKLKTIFIAVLIFVLFAGISYLIPSQEGLQNIMLNLVIGNSKSPIIILCSIIMILSFTLKNITINKLNFMMLLIFIFIVVTPFCNVFDFLSLYEFVAKRALTTYIYTFVVLNFIYLMILVGKLSNGGFRIKFLSRSSLILLTICAFISANFNSQYNIIEKYQIIIKNNLLIPNTTVELANNLNDYYNETGEEIYMVMQERVGTHHYTEAPSIMMRTFSQHIYPITAIIRYGVTEGNDFSQFSKEDQTIINNFIGNTSHETYQPLKRVLNKYPINCVITMNETRYLADSGFSLYKTIDDEEAFIHYYIYIKSS